MTASASYVAGHTAGLRIPGAVAAAGGAVACAVLALVAAAGVAALGGWSLAVPLYAGLVLWLVVSPRTFAYGLLFLFVAIEPSPIDFTKPLGIALYNPPGFKDALPFEMSPMEILLGLNAVMLVLREGLSVPGGRRVPLLTWAAPVAIFLGLAYGLRMGADQALAYHEARGLIWAIPAFFIATRLAREEPGRAVRVAFAASTVMALIQVIRYFAYTRGGEAGVPVEFAFAHENAVLLGLGFILAAVLFIRTDNRRARLFFVAHNLLVLAATMGSGRRAGTLVLVVGLLVMAWFMLPRRPVKVVSVALPLMLLGGVYLAAYWDNQYGGFAQPARAIRSQISPDPRDESSDGYRENEKFNVIETIRLNKPFGVGFGRPFAGFIPLPDMRAWWPLQFHTPHQNILWLWLKMGVVGISVFLGIWVLALKRCIEAFKPGEPGEISVLPLFTGCGLLMYLAYARVDLALTGIRSIGALAVLVALAFQMTPKHPGEAAAGPTAVAPGEGQQP